MSNNVIKKYICIQNNARHYNSLLITLPLPSLHITLLMSGEADLIKKTHLINE